MDTTSPINIRIAAHSATTCTVAWDTSPREKYTITIASKREGEQEIPRAQIQIESKSVFSRTQLSKLYQMALAYDALPNGWPINQFSSIYRCESTEYFDNIEQNRYNVIEKQLRSNRGHRESPINGAIKGVFFVANLHYGGLPKQSPFGEKRLIIPAEYYLADPNAIRLYFVNFYCMKTAHYFTVVVCKCNSEEDLFFRDRRIPELPKENPFLQICDNRTYLVNANIWVEICLTENVFIDREHMRFDTVEHVKHTGIERWHNESCSHCNLSAAQMLENDFTIDAVEMNVDQV